MQIVGWPKTLFEFSCNIVQTVSYNNKLFGQCNKTTNPYLPNSENVKPLYKKSKQNPR